MLVIYNLL